MIEKKDNHVCFYVLLVGLIILIAARYAFQVDISRLALAFVVIVIAALGDNDEIVSIIISCVILNHSISFYLAITICAIIYYLKNINKFKIRLPVFLIFITFLWELLHCFSIDSNVISSLGSMMPLVVLMVIMSIDVHNIDYCLVIRSLAFVLISICLIQMGSLVAFGDVDFANLQRLGSFEVNETMIGMEINPNTLGIITILVITGLLQLRFIGKHSKYDVILIAIILVFGILTSSRTFLACFIVMLGSFIFLQTGGMLQKIKTFILIMLFFAFALFLNALIFTDTLYFFLNRFSTNDITTGRDVLMSVYHNYIINNVDIMFFGVGMSNFTEKVLNIYNISDHTPHNCVQEIIVAWGIPGLIIMCLLFVAMIIESQRYGRRQTIINYIPLLIILLKSMAGQLLTSGYTMLALSFAYLSLCQDFGERKEQN